MLCKDYNASTGSMGLAAALSGYFLLREDQPRSPVLPIRGGNSDYVAHVRSETETKSGCTTVVSNI